MVEGAIFYNSREFETTKCSSPVEGPLSLLRISVDRPDRCLPLVVVLENGNAAEPERGPQSSRAFVAMSGRGRRVDSAVGAG